MKQKNIILSITSGLTLLFFLPLSMAMNNAVYINNWGPLLGGIVLVSLLVSVLLFAALSKSKPVVASFVQAVLVSFFLLVYFFSDNQVFDGKSNDIESWQWLALTSVKILTVNFILLACFYFPEAFFRNIKKICSFMLIFQVLFVVNKYNATVRSSYLVKTTFEESSAYSAKDNIIILVLDTFSSGLFKDILKTNPQKYQKMFEGFTWYSETVPGFAITMASVPFIQTGRQYKGDVTFSDYLVDIEKDNLRNFLKDYSHTNINYYNRQVESLVQKHPVKIFYKLSLIKIFPFLQCWLLNDEEYNVFNLKPDRFMVTEPKDVNNNASFEKTIPSMHIGADQTYKFIHLLGVHLPYAFDADGNRKFAASEMDVGLNSLRIVDKYLSKLKEIGAFDNSLIFIIGDHGNSQERKLLYDKEYGKALMLFKDYRSPSKALSENRALVTNGDIPKTIASVLERQNNYEGVDIRSAGRENRKLTWCNHEYTTEYNRKIPMDCYVVYLENGRINLQKEVKND